MYLVEIIQFHFSFLETNKLRLFGVDKNIRPIEKSHACQRTRVLSEQERKRE